MDESEVQKLADLFLGIGDSYFRDNLVASFNEAGFGWVMIPSRGKDYRMGMVEGYEVLKDHN